MARKTFAVADLVTSVNLALRVSPDENKQGREALAVMLESVLHDTGNYRGFSYLPSEFKRNGESGIYDHLPNPPDHQLRVGYDDSRRAYF